MTRAKPLLTEFSTPTLTDWEATLRGKPASDYDWQCQDGRNFPALFAAPAEPPHAHTSLAAHLQPRSPWRIRQRIEAADPSDAAAIAAAAIGDGSADELIVILDALGQRGGDPSHTPSAAQTEDLEPGLGGCAIYSLADLGSVLAGVDLATTRIAFQAGDATLPVARMLLDLAAKRGVAADTLRAELGLDPIRDFVRGTHGSDPESLLAECVQAFELTTDHPGVQPLCAHGSIFHDAGASPSQELGATLATAIAIIRTLIEAGIPATKACQAICLRLPTNTDILAEIAKIRAARVLWAKIATAFGSEDPSIAVHAESSSRSWSSDDAKTNLLRSSIQGFAATLAGADSIQLSPFERGEDEAQAQAIARNQLVLLREESLLQRVGDPCAGSYAIEAMTDALARDSWTEMQRIESQGGILASLQAGAIQAPIQEHAQARHAEVCTTRRVLVGSNRFVDLRFRETQTAEPAYEPQTTAPQLAALVQRLRGTKPLQVDPPLRPLAPEGAALEALRGLVLADAPKVTIRAVGNSRITRARADFARDFFATGGFDVLPDEADATAVIEVWCGDNEAVDAAFEANPDITQVIAAQPRDTVPASDATFIHMRSDRLAILRSLYLATTPEPTQTEEEGT